MKNSRKFYEGTGVLSSVMVLLRTKRSALIHKPMIEIKESASFLSTDPTSSPSPKKQGAKVCKQISAWSSTSLSP